MVNLRKLGFRLTHTKGQEISGWKYEVIALPKIWKKIFEKLYPEICWPLFAYTKYKNSPTGNARNKNNNPNYIHLQ